MASQRIIKRQTEAEKIAIRSAQRKLGEDVLANKDEIMKVSSNAADDYMQQQKVLFDKVGSTREGCVDSEIFRNLSQFTSKQAFVIGQDSSAIDSKLFLSKLREQRINSKSGGIDWEGLGKDVNVFFNSVSTMSFMLGPMSVPQKVRQQIQRQKKEIHEKQKPSKISHNEAKKAKKTEHQKFQDFMMAQLHLHCNQSARQTKKEKKKCVEMFKFLTNPRSFTQTVENVFEFSFLVKDGWAGIGLDQDDLPGLYPLRGENEEDAKSGEKSKDDAAQTVKTRDEQAVITFNMEDWTAFKEIHDLIDDSILPHRTDKEYEEPMANESDVEVHSDSEEQGSDSEGD